MPSSARSVRPIDRRRGIQEVAHRSSRRSRRGRSTVEELVSDPHSDPDGSVQVQSCVGLLSRDCHLPASADASSPERRRCGGQQGVGRRRILPRAATAASSWRRGCLSVVTRATQCPRTSLATLPWDLHRPLIASRTASSDLWRWDPDGGRAVRPRAPTAQEARCGSSGAGRAASAVRGRASRTAAGEAVSRTAGGCRASSSWRWSEKAAARPGPGRRRRAARGESHRARSVEPSAPNSRSRSGEKCGAVRRGWQERWGACPCGPRRRGRRMGP